MHVVALALILLAADPEPVRLVAPSFSVSGVQPQTARVWSDYLVQELGRRGLVIQTEADIAAVLGAERQRQLMGCGDQSCIAELAGALGSDGLLLGSVAKADDTRVLNLRVVSKTGQPLAAASYTGEGESAVISALPMLARELVTQLRPKFDAGRIPEEQKRLKKTHALLPSITAGVVGGIGVLLLQQAGAVEARIRQGVPAFTNEMELNGTIGSGRAFELSGWACIGLATVALGVAIVIVIIGEPP